MRLNKKSAKPITKVNKGKPQYQSDEHRMVHGKITKIEKQKLGKKYNLFLEGVFAFSVYEETILKFNLSSGNVLDKARTINVINYDKQIKALNNAYSLLAVRPRSKNEIRTRLKQKQYPDDVIDKIIMDLEKKNLLSDEQFSRLWVESANRKLKSKQQIRYELYKKGIDRSEIDKILNDLDNDQELKKAKRLIEKYQDKYVKLEPFKRKQKLQAMLLRKGYGWDIVKEILSENIC